jgi:NADPH:quinone reductase-like Zn-dependent oxidoreductase
VSPIEDVVALGNDSPMGPGFGIYGEHMWGGHATFAVAPSRNVVPRPAGRSWEECAAYPLAWLTAYRMLRRARLQAGQTVLVVGIGSGVSCAALAIARHLGAEVVATSRSELKRHEALAMGAVAAVDSADERWPVQADVVVESVGAATWDRSVLFFKQFEIIGSSMGSYQEFAEVTALMAQGLEVRVDEVLELSDYPAALARLDAGDQLGKIVLRH